MRRRWLTVGVLVALAGSTPAEASVKRADLVLTKAGVGTRQASPGDSVTLTWTVANRGRRAVPASATHLFLSTDAKRDKRDVRLGTARERGLRAGKSTRRSLRVTIPAKTAPAAYRLLVCADASRKVRERSERNNCRATATLRVVPHPVAAPAPASEPVPAPAPAHALSVAIRDPGEGGSVRHGASVTLHVTSTRGLRALEVRLRGKRVGQMTEPEGNGELSRTVVIDAPEALNGTALLEATATDGAGVQVDAEPVVVEVDNPLRPETRPTTVLFLDEPVALSALAPTLAASGVRVAEYFSERRLPSGEILTGGFYGRGLTLDDQIATYTAVRARTAPGQEPEVFGLRVEGDADPAQLGALGGLVADAERVNAGEDFSAARARVDGTRVGARRQARPATVQDDPPRLPWWPSFGQLQTNEYSAPMNRCIFIVLLCNPSPSERVDRVTFTHTLVWSGGAMFDEEIGKAYEHDLKIEADGNRAGIRPWCFGDGGFYASRTGGVVWETTVPALAAPYLDADALDSCSTADLTIGIAFPEHAARHHLDPPRSTAGGVWWTTGHRITVDAQRDRPSGTFKLAAQWLDRSTCDLVMRQVVQFCVGSDVTRTEVATILDAGNKLLPGVEFPVCVAWAWPPSFKQTTPTRMARCVGDRDRDGWDDGIDCGPDSLSVHPGAFEYVQDGIDQDCDGEDPITIGRR